MNRPHLFQSGDFVLHSGARSTLKLECDALCSADWETIAAQIAARWRFCEVIGIPRGGVPLARALQPYVDMAAVTTLVVDDVLTTGRSMEETRQASKRPRHCQGVVLFARGVCPHWIAPMFQMWGPLEQVIRKPSDVE